MSKNTKDIQSSTKFLKEQSEVGRDGYKGIPIFAAVNLHEKCFEVFQSMNLPKESKILVLGAGGGAFDQRLIDNGYKNIWAVEFVKDSYKAENEKVFDYDLNEDFHLKFGNEQFDVVIAIEIIEHLYSPFDFLKKIKTILCRGGHILLSTPNPENGVSRIKFLLARKLQLFSELDLKGSGHIVPIFDHIFRYFLESLGYTTLLKTSNGHIFKFVSLKLKFLYIIFSPLIFYKRDDGQIHVYLIKN